jgi:hypothetical protein
MKPEMKNKWYFDRIVNELLNGLVTDGAHHKQHSLEFVLRMMCEDEWVDAAKKQLQWQDGIPA